LFSSERPRHVGYRWGMELLPSVQSLIRYHSIPRGTAVLVIDCPPFSSRRLRLIGHLEAL
jgi:hypothetical protein